MKKFHLKRAKNANIQTKLDQLAAQIAEGLCLASSSDNWQLMSLSQMPHFEN